MEKDNLSKHDTLFKTLVADHESRLLAKQARVSEELVGFTFTG
jgi:hypothetical protein